MEVRANKLVSGPQVLAILLLSAATLLFSGMVDRYRVTGDELLVNHDFEKGLHGWERSNSGTLLFSDSGPGMRLSSDGGGTAYIKQVLDGVIKEGRPVQLSATLKTEGVGVGEKVWEAARIIFLGINGSGKPMYYVPHALVMRNGTTGWEDYSRVFISYSDVDRQQVEIQLVNVKGTVWVKNLSLRLAEEVPSYRLYWGINVLSWLVLCMWVLVPRLRSLASGRRGIMLFLMLVVVLAGVLMPVNMKHAVGEVLKVFYPWVGGETGVFRVGHFLVFASLSCAVFLKVQAKYILWERFVALALFVLVTETLQLLVDGRSFRVGDLLIDGAGVGAGFLLSRIWAVGGEESGRNTEFGWREVRDNHASNSVKQE